MCKQETKRAVNKTYIGLFVLFEINKAAYFKFVIFYFAVIFYKFVTCVLISYAEREFSQRRYAILAHLQTAP